MTICVGFPNITVSLPPPFNVNVNYNNNLNVPGNLFPIPANAIPCCKYSIPTGYNVPIKFNIIPPAALLAIITTINASIQSGLTQIKQTINIPPCMF